jgi:hypothetical protein
MAQKSRSSAYIRSEKARSAAERGKALPFYTREVAQEMLAPKRSGKRTPSKKA